MRVGPIGELGAWMKTHHYHYRRYTEHHALTPTCSHRRSCYPLPQYLGIAGYCGCGDNLANGINGAFGQAASVTA